MYIYIHKYIHNFKNNKMAWKLINELAGNDVIKEY